MFIAPHAQLKTYTTYRIGGTCTRMVFPEVEADLKELPGLIGDRPYLIMGNGSNILFGDRLFDAVMINLIKWRGVEFDAAKHAITIKSGTPITEFINVVKKQHLGDYDFLAGIPGSIGGAVYMNAGAWGRSICPFIRSVQVFSLQTKRLRTIPKDKLKYAYRRQEFLHPGDILISITLDAIEHDDKISDKISAILRLRHDKHPSESSCGSFFKNFSDISAGTLIEACGLKGAITGDAEISKKHANFIINHGKATFSDIVTLSLKAQKAVRAQYERELEPEVKILSSVDHPLFQRLPSQ